MVDETDLRELGLWAALWRIDPWGEERADLRSAITSFVIAESKRDPKKKSKPYSPRDFMPYAHQAVEKVASKVKSVMKLFPKKGH
jgi:hypothetical protein